MNQGVDQLIAHHLDGGERLLWWGQPGQGVRLHPTDAILIPFSLMWGGFAIVWEVMAIREGAPIFFLLWGVPFVIVGTYLIAGRFWWDAKRRSRTFYGVTDKRIILLSGVRRSQVRSVNLRTLGDLSVTERSDGTGDVTLGAAPWMMSWFAGAGWPGMQAQLPPTLESVPRAREVYDTIRKAQTAAA